MPPVASRPPDPTRWRHPEEISTSEPPLAMILSAKFAPWSAAERPQRALRIARWRKRLQRSAPTERAGARTYGCSVQACLEILGGARLRPIGRDLQSKRWPACPLEAGLPRVLTAADV
jgi:hypothetical protein